MKKGLTLTMTAALAVSALTPAAAFAAETPTAVAKPGLYNIVTGQFYDSAQYKALDKATQKAVIKDANFFLVSGGQVYKGLDVVTTTSVNLDKVATPEATFEADNEITLTAEGTVLDKEGNIIKPDTETPGDVAVESVSAITTTIEKAANQQLKIQINGDKEVTAKELTDAGYTVKFLYNQAASANYNPTTGVVNGVNATSPFKYAVEVTPAEGEKITSAWTDVSVVDVAKLDKVTAVELSNELTYVNVGETGVSIDATEAVNVGGKTVTEGLPAVKSITSSDETVLYADATNNLVARKAGNVKLTVEFAGIKDKLTLDVAVKAQQEATSISDATLKTSLTSKIAKFNVLDKDSKELRPGSKVPTLTAVVTDATGEAVQTVSGDQSQFKTGVEISSITKAGTYSVEVKDGSTKIGSYTLQVVDTANAAADEYKILTAGNKTSAELDINAGDNTANTTTVDVKDYANGVALNSTLDLMDASKFEVTTGTKDSKVVTVTPKSNGKIQLDAGTETGTEIITLKTVSGDYKETVATFTVTVKNTTPQVTTLAVKDSKDPIVLNETWLKDVAGNEDNIKTAIASKVQSNLEAFGKDLIEKFEITSQGTVIVTIKSENGGKEFTLPFTVKDDVAPELIENDAVVYDADGETITFTFDEAVALTSTELADAIVVAEGSTLGTDASLTIDGAKVVINLGPNATIEANATVTLKAANIKDKATTPNVLENDAVFTNGDTAITTADTIAPTLENATLALDGNALLVSFSLSEAIDLATKADVELSYFTKVGEKLTPITNSIAGANLVKNKTWAGYLANVNEPAGNYSTGTDNDVRYSDLIAKDVLIGSKLQKGYRVDASMDYVETTDFSTTPGTYVVQIKVTDNAGNVTTDEVELIVPAE